MSQSMFMGRVVLPGAALIVAVALTWQSVRAIAQKGDAGPVRLQSIAVQGAVLRITAEGRVVAYPGARVTVGTEVLGTIINMPACAKAAVRKGDLLAELRSDEVKASLREAHHRLTESEVALRIERVPRSRPAPHQGEYEGTESGGRARRTGVGRTRPA